MGITYNQKEPNFENYGFPGLVYDFSRAGNLRDGVSKRTDYISIGRTTTGTYVGSDGLIKTAAAFEPRFEYDSSGNRLGLLVEESGRNLWTSSESTILTGFGFTNNTSLPTGIITLRGGTTATKINTGVTQTWWSSGSGNFTFNVGYYIMSWWSYTTLESVNFGTSDYFNTPNSTISSQTISTPGIWTRCFRVSYFATSGAAQVRFMNYNSTLYANANNEVFITGAQLEYSATLPSLTSYIPTSGSAVTRAADNPIIVSPNFYNSSNSSIILHYTPRVGVTTVTQPLLSFDDNTTNNEVKVSIAGTTPTLNVVNAGVTTVAIGTAPNVSTTGVEYRVSLSAKDNQFTLTSEGIGIVTTTSGSLPVGITTMRIGHDKSGNSFNGYIKKLIYYPKELTTPALRVFSTVQEGYNLIANEGLVLHLDAGNRKSYPESGTAWRDLSGRGNTGTLVNGVGYSGSNLGSLVFDGVDDYVTTGLVLPSPSTTATTFDLVFKFNNTNSYRGLIGASAYQSSGFSIGFMGQTSIRMTYNASGLSYEQSWTYDSSVISNGVFVFDGRNITAYRNGSVISTYTASFDVVANGNGMQIARNLQGGWGVSQCNIYYTRVYNRALTASEIQQNYNATKSRFQ